MPHSAYNIHHVSQNLLSFNHGFGNCLNFEMIKFTLQSILLASSDFPDNK